MPTTVILGAGIIGLSTAYYLSSQSPSETIHLVESSPALFASASGKAAGFLARDWFPAASSALGALSFDLHKKLAEEHNGKEKWGWGPSVSYSLDSTKGTEKGEDWLLAGASRASVVAETRDGDVRPKWLTNTGALRKLSDSDTTGIVDPLRLCEWLLEQCKSRCVRLHHPAKATKVLTTDSSLSGIQVTYSDTGTTSEIPCDALVISAGAWTTLVYRTLFPAAPRAPHISSLAGHSLVFKSPHWTGADEAEGGGVCHAVFTTHPGGFSPEIFSRVGGHIWLGGLNDAHLDVPELATDVKTDEKSTETLREVGRWLCGDELEVIREGLCHRPVTRTGVPLVARVPEGDLGGVKGRVYVASGHGPWGISLSLGTGLVVSEMVLGMKTSADISALARF